LVVVAVMGYMAALVLALTTHPSHSAAATTGGCSGDETAQLNAAIAAQPDNSTLNVPPRTCFTVDGTLNVDHKSNIVINGNGSIFKRSNAAQAGSFTPMLQMVQDSNISISNLTLQGGYDGTNYGGGSYEGDSGIVLEADHGISFDQIHVQDVQGDFMYLSPPNDANPPTGDLNTQISVLNSSFVQAGYHGLTVQSANGFTVAFCRFLSIGVDAMDFEVDNASTYFTNGQPRAYAEDNVTIAGNIWTNWGHDWFASLQGQTPGTSEQNLVLYGNVLNGVGPIFEVVGTNPALTTQPYTNDHWTIEYNAFTPGYYGYAYHGGYSVAGQLYDISHLTMQHNTFPLCIGLFEVPEPQSLCGTPAEYLFDLDVVTYSTIVNNDFSGGLGPILPQPYNTYNYGTLVCGNKIDNVC
jgi:hypothetical protein